MNSPSEICDTLMHIKNAFLFADKLGPKFLHIVLQSPENYMRDSKRGLLEEFFITFFDALQREI